MNARSARLKEAKDNNNAAEQHKVALENEYASIKEQLEKAKTNLSHIDSKVAGELIEGEKKIKGCVDKIHKIREEADKTENLIGMRGSTLLACLSSIRSFAKSEKNTTLLWQPLISVLEYITSMSESSVALLEGDKADVFVGGLRLLKNVGFYQSTTQYLLRETSPSEAYNRAIENAKTKKFLN